MSTDTPALTPATAAALAWLNARLGKVVHTSDWFAITQERIQKFAEATADHQWIHIDVERAKRESPYKGTIAHGYLTLSLYPALRGLVDGGKPMLEGMQNVINYGLNKTRFPAPVRSGSRVRAVCTLQAAEPVAPNTLQLTEVVTMEVEGQTKPACVAEAIMRIGF